MDLNLPCWYCPEGSLTYPDFAPLAIHVQRDHFRRVNYSGKGGIWDMNVGQHVSGSDRLPLIDSAMFKRLQKNGKVVGKVLAVREINSPKFKGLALDLKNGDQKFGFLCSFERFDVGSIVSQLKSNETDDWIGCNLRFVSKKGSKGNRQFVNVEYVKRGKK